MKHVKIIKKVANDLGIHPIHAKMFFLRLNSDNKDDSRDYSDAYQNFKKESPKPFVKWVGGKRQLAKQFREMNLYPPDAFDPRTATYHEPFVGGGAMFFDLLSQKAVISDLNKELIIKIESIKNNICFYIL